MNISIRNKIFIALVVATLLLVIFMTYAIQWSFDRGFLEYINVEEQEEVQLLAEKLEEYYGNYLSWDGLADKPIEILKMHAMVLSPEKSRRFWDDLSKEKLPFDFQKNSPYDEKEGDKKEEHRRFPIQRTVILDQTGTILFGEKILPKLPHMTPLMHKDERVGSIGLYAPQKLFDLNQVTFVQKQTTFILIVFVVSIVIAIGFSMFLAFSLAKPIRQLSSAAEKLNEGNYSVQVSVGHRDELARLSQNFNTLANTLRENQLQRERWVSDIAHELRTPLTSLKGQIEALQDGIRTPDQRTYDRLQHGVGRLERLVDDLYDLNLSDIGTFALVKDKVALNEILKTELLAFRNDVEQAGLNLCVTASSRKLPVQGDTQRLQQMIGNLLTNSVRYTDRGGEIHVKLGKDGESAVLEIADSAPGVPDNALPRLFDRLYRVDESRSRTLGGSGLGLSICREIVAAHGGTITADHSASGGLLVIISIPLSTDKKS